MAFMLHHSIQGEISPLTAFAMDLTALIHSRSNHKYFKGTPLFSTLLVVGLLCLDIFLFSLTFYFHLVLKHAIDGIGPCGVSYNQYFIQYKNLPQSCWLKQQQRLT